MARKRWQLLPRGTKKVRRHQFATKPHTKISLKRRQITVLCGCVSASVCFFRFYSYEFSDFCSRLEPYKTWFAWCAISRWKPSQRHIYCHTVFRLPKAPGKWHIVFVFYPLLRGENNLTNVVADFEKKIALIICQPQQKAGNEVLPQRKCQGKERDTLFTQHPSHKVHLWHLQLFTS